MATKLMRMQEIVGDGKRSGSAGRAISPVEGDELITLAEENRRLRVQVKNGDAALRKSYVRSRV